MRERKKSSIPYWIPSPLPSPGGRGNSALYFVQRPNLCRTVLGFCLTARRAPTNQQLLHYFLLFFLLLFTPCNSITADNTPLPLSLLPGVTSIEGQQAPLLLHQPISTIQVYALHGDRSEPIPFQIDERDNRNRWVLDQGPQLKSEDSPNVFDENDVLVLMNRDLGERGNLARLPKEATAWVEVRVGSEAAPLGFVYVGIFAKIPIASLSHSQYTRYDAHADKVDTDRYTIAFAGAPFPTHLAFVDHLGDTAANLIAGVRVIGEVRFLRGLFTLRRTEQDIHAEVLAYRQGAIRTIRRARYWIPLPLGFRTNGRIDVLFYRDFVEGTAIVKLKVPPRLVLADGELQAYFRFLDLSGARLLVEGKESNSTVDGHMDTAEQALQRCPARWAALVLPNGRTLLLIARLEGALQRLEQRLYFDDHEPTEAQPGTKPAFGFEFSGINQVETGTHRLSVFAIMLDTTSDDDIRRTIERFLAPPAVSITPLPASG